MKQISRSEVNRYLKFAYECSRKTPLDIEKAKKRISYLDAMKVIRSLNPKE